MYKVILAAQSSFFRKLFYREPKEVYEIGALYKIGLEAVIGLMYGSQDYLDYVDIMPWSTVVQEYMKIIEDTALYLGCQLIDGDDSSFTDEDLDINNYH